MTEVFPHLYLSFSISAIFRGKQVVKVGLKCKLWVRLFFMKTQILQVFFKQCFRLIEYYLWREFRQYWTIFVGVTAQKPPKKDHFMGAESVRKFLT